jgi:hypothetical protein
MPTLRETLQPRRDIERRAVGRTTINRDASLFFMGQESVHVVGRACRFGLSDTALLGYMRLLLTRYASLLRGF